MVMVGLVYKLGGRWKEAEDLQVQVMETRKRVLGAKYPSTPNSMNNLASIYGDQGRWKEAEELEVQVIETSKRVRGPEHTHTLTLTNIGNLAITWKRQGRATEAFVLIEESVRIQDGLEYLEKERSLVQRHLLCKCLFSRLRFLGLFPSGAVC
jgi:hypothetical protein